MINTEVNWTEGINELKRNSCSFLRYISHSISYGSLDLLPLFVGIFLIILVAIMLINGIAENIETDKLVPSKEEIDKMENNTKKIRHARIAKERAKELEHITNRNRVYIEDPLAGKLGKGIDFMPKEGVTEMSYITELAKTIINPVELRQKTFEKAQENIKEELKIVVNEVSALIIMRSKNGHGYIDVDPDIKRLLLKYDFITWSMVSKVFQEAGYRIACSPVNAIVWYDPTIDDEPLSKTSTE